MLFRLAENLDLSAAARKFARDGHVRIRNFLNRADAEAIRTHLRDRRDWVQAIHSEGKIVEIDRPTREAFTRERRETLDAAVYGAARYGFQYRYETLRVPDDPVDRDRMNDPVADFASALSSAPCRDMLRAIVGDSAVMFADAQATAFSPGDFLTGHDDAVEGKHRIAAYVFSLNPQWRVEWGGLLLFHGKPFEDEIDRALVPSFNTLDLFAVPQMHSVSEVSRAAPFRRYAITGWLRSKD